MSLLIPKRECQFFCKQNIFGVMLETCEENKTRNDYSKVFRLDLPVDVNAFSCVYRHYVLWQHNVNDVMKNKRIYVSFFSDLFSAPLTLHFFKYEL